MTARHGIFVAPFGELAGEARALRGSSAMDGLLITNPPGTDPEPWTAAGATWCLTGLGSRPRVADVQTAIDAYSPA